MPLAEFSKLVSDMVDVLYPIPYGMGVRVGGRVGVHFMLALQAVMPVWAE